MPKLDWKKTYGNKSKNDLPKTDFNKAQEKEKKSKPVLNARGVPDIKAIKQDIDRKMIKYRRGLP